MLRAVAGGAGWTSPADRGGSVALGKAGEWISLERICDGLPRLAGRVEPLVGGAESRPHVTWLTDPFADLRAGYCLITVYWEACQGCGTALYNRARLPGL